MLLGHLTDHELDAWVWTTTSRSASRSFVTQAKNCWSIPSDSLRVPDLQRIASQHTGHNRTARYELQNPRSTLHLSAPKKLLCRHSISFLAVYRHDNRGSRKSQIRDFQRRKKKTNMYPSVGGTCEPIKTPPFLLILSSLRNGLTQVLTIICVVFPKQTPNEPSPAPAFSFPFRSFSWQ